MANKYRLHSDVYDREAPGDRVAPKKVYYISTEGVNTEVEYLRGLSDYRTELGINVLVNVEVLRRHNKDGCSAPEQVVELLEEYIDLRGTGKEILSDFPEEIKKNYDVGFIRRYLESPGQIAEQERKAFELDLTKAGYDLAYRRYLARCANESDEFCILIDRDMGSHSEDDMRFIVEYCEGNAYRCFISNPCFEFWLLLHFLDAKEEYADRLDLIRKNEKKSAAHTYVSYELSKVAHHGKKGIAFRENYLPNVELAVERASKFASDNDELIKDIGCNIWKLIEEMRDYE